MLLVACRSRQLTTQPFGSWRENELTGDSGDSRENLVVFVDFEVEFSFKSSILRLRMCERTGKRAESRSHLLDDILLSY